MYKFKEGSTSLKYIRPMKVKIICPKTPAKLIANGPYNITVKIELIVIPIPKNPDIKILIQR